MRKVPRLLLILAMSFALLCGCTAQTQVDASEAVSSEQSSAEAVSLEQSGAEVVLERENTDDTR